MASVCTCEQVTLDGPDGTTVTGITGRDPCCQQHGYPDDRWRPGDPLRRYARRVRTTVFLPAVLDLDGRVVVDEDEYISREREETPRQVEARLYYDMRQGRL